MGNLHLVTGHAGQAHVTAADQASLNAGIFGEGNIVLHRGGEFAATVISNNTIRIADGDIIMQGRHIRLNEGNHVDLAIQNGKQNTNRNDLIVVRYTKNGQTGVEDCNLVVIKGTETTGSAKDPAYNTGDIINDHVLQADMPLYRVPLEGLNVKALVCLFDMPSISLSSFSGTIPMNRGGTGATSGAEGLKNLFAAGATVLSANQFGATLPNPGTPGRIFFKKVT